MNIDNINGIIDWLKRRQGNGFAMSSFNYYSAPGAAYAPQDHEHCGTTFCLAGYCEIQSQLQNGVARDKLRIDTWYGKYVKEGGRHLGINSNEAEQLFMMLDRDSGRSAASMGEFDQLCAPLRSAIAIRVLENLRDTGEVNWQKAAREVIGRAL